MSAQAISHPVQTLESQRARFEAVSNAFEARLRDYERKGLGGLLAAYAIGLPCAWLYVRFTSDEGAWTVAAVLAVLQLLYLAAQRFVLIEELSRLRRLHHDLTSTGAVLLLTNHSRGREAQLSRTPPEGVEDRVITPERLVSVRAYGHFLRRTEL